MKSIRPSIIVNPTFLNAILALSNLHFTASFAIKDSQPSSFTKNLSVSSLQMSPLEFPTISLTLSSPVLSTAISSKLLPFSVGDSSIVSELIGDAALTSNLIDSTKNYESTSLSMQILAIIGRLFCIALNFVPNHNVLPIELIYQSIMLSIALTGIFNTLKDTNTSCKGLSMKDQKCFNMLFRPAGLSCIQYKQLLEAGVLEWIEVKSGNTIVTNKSNVSTIDNGNCNLYWLQSGELEIESDGSVLRTLVPKSSHLFGDIYSLFPAIASNEKNFIRENSKNSSSTTVRAKSNYATVIQIDTSRIKELMDKDKALRIIMQGIILEAMQAQIMTLLFPLEVNSERKTQ